MAAENTEIQEDTNKAPTPALSTSSVTPAETSTQQPSKELVSATPASPASVQRSQPDVAASTPKTTSKIPTRPAVPAVPVLPALPALPKSSPKDVKPVRAEKPSTSEAATDTTKESVVTNAAPTEAADASAEAEPKAAEAIPEPQPRAPPTSWANLFAKSKTGGSGKAAGPNGSATTTGVNGHAADGANGSNGATPALSKTNSSSVAEAIQAYHVGDSEKISFLEPRGLINTGNMCYMNSVSLLVSMISFAILTPIRCCKF